MYVHIEMYAWSIGGFVLFGFWLSQFSDSELIIASPEKPRV